MDARLKAFAFLALLFFLAIAFSSFTGALPVLAGANFSILTLAVACHVLSQLAWIAAWGVFLKPHTTRPLSDLALVGWASVYGAVTPMQLGSEALRVYYAKKHLQVSGKMVLAASLFVKGLKFALLFLASSLALYWLVASVSLNASQLFLLLSGLAGMFFTSLAFAAGLSSRLQPGFRGLFSRLQRLKIPKSEALGEFFKSYYEASRNLTARTLSVVVALAAASTLFEFLSLKYSFEAVGLAFSAIEFIALFALFQALERTPLAPKGVGVVEVVGYLAITSNFFTALPSSESAWAALIVFNFVRVIVPTIASLLVAGTLGNPKSPAA